MDTSSVDHLPDEIIEVILSKSPVKSVVRFKSVAKSWQSIISSPRFSRLHHIQRSKLTENRNKFFLYGHPYGRDLCVIGVEDGKFRRESVLGYPFGMSIVPVCSCDGLILLQHGFGLNIFMLWNPFIGKHITIPTFKHTHPYFRHCHLYHNSITDDYKILFLYGKYYTVYSCKNGSWEVKDFPYDWDTYNVIKFIAGIDGCLYGMKRYRRSTEILCYDVRDEKLHKLPHPKGAKGLYQVELKEVSGRLCLSGFSDYLMLQLWVMEENKSWRKLISMKERFKTIYQRSLIYNCSLIPKYVSYDDVVLWSPASSEYDTDKHFIYNRQNCSFQENLDFTWESFHQCFPYSENLYMPSINIC